MTEQYSPTSPTPSAFYDPESWSWRTSQASLLSAVPESLDRLPDWGTTSDGALFELRTPERLTAARGGSASLPTPCASGENAQRNLIERRRKKQQMQLVDVLREMETVNLLPTPVVNDMGAGKSVEEWDTWTDEMKAKHGNGNGPSLSIEVQRLLPTPRAQNGEPRNMKPWVRALDQPQNLENAIARLLPTPQHCDHKVFGPNVDWKKRAESHADSVASVLMNLPLNDGNEPLDGPHLTQLMIEGCDPDSLNG